MTFQLGDRVRVVVDRIPRREEEVECRNALGTVMVINPLGKENVIYGVWIDDIPRPDGEDSRYWNLYADEMVSEEAPMALWESWR